MNYSRRQFVRTLFIASQAPLLGRLAYGDIATGAGDKNALHFLVIGDWGRLGRPDQHQVATQMAETAQSLGAAFVISAGDNFYEDGVESATDPQWKESFENVYRAPSLQTPWYVILGNHDYHGNCQAQLDYATTHPRWVMPARYYTQTRSFGSSSAVDFVFIDTSPMVKSYRKEDKIEHPKLRENVLTQDVPTQLQWLEETLAGSKADWKIVVGHHPIYSGGMHGDQPELIQQVLPLLQKYNVQAYFCGHDHDLQHLKAGKIDLFVSGGGSEHRPSHEVAQSQFDKSSSGFMAISLRKDELLVRVID
ncbi:MAG TPA: tartrate-resistant acid phosphatase type 5 family protein, partial [Candidatus Methylacidiphilales bacterium]|nr:tartrate-resistant acid phosphatase type 5 family protein [Candidatus Methylacidiphilales bacterium]